MKKIMLALAAASLSLGACTQVDTGHRGVETHFGKVVSGSLPEGLYWYMPFFGTSYEQMDVRQQKWGANTETYTKDVQKADISFVMNYHLNPTKAHVMFSRVGQEWTDNIIPQMTSQAIKNEFGRWDAVKVVENRGAVASNIEASLRAKLAKQDVVLDSFDLVNVKYTGDFEQAVEAKQVAIQNATKEVNNTQAVIERGKQAVFTAEANAKALKATSDALEANPKLIEYEAIKKWDGTVPQTMVGGSAPYSIMLNK
jgi:prohibitin 2